MSSSVYTAVPGWFIQDSPDADPASIGPLPPRLGLLSDSPHRWSVLRARLDAVNAQDQGVAVYKLVFLCRHGQGVHNVAEAKYGTEAWDTYYSTLNGDGKLTWGPAPGFRRDVVMNAIKMSACIKTVPSSK